MNDISSILQDTEKVDVEEWTRQGSAVEFNSGKQQSVVRTSIPAYELKISYKSISQSRFEALRNEYENNHANTATLDVDSLVDDLRDTGSKTWIFSDFKFTLDGTQRFTGQISLISSVLFNHPQYTAGIVNASSYDQTANETTDTSFMDMLQICTPYQIVFEYLSNSLVSQIGSSVHHSKDKSGLRRRFKYSWYIQEAEFIELQKFFRKKSILGVIGITDLATFGIGGSLKKTFKVMNDSLKFTKNRDGMFKVQAEVFEVIT